MKNIVIIEDNQELIHSLTYAIESTEKYKIIKSYTSAEDAIKDIDNNIPDFIIMDIALQGKMNGIKCTLQSKKIYINDDKNALTSTYNFTISGNSITVTSENSRTDYIMLIKELINTKLVLGITDSRDADNPTQTKMFEKTSKNAQDFGRN